MTEKGKQRSVWGSGDTTMDVDPPASGYRMVDFWLRFDLPLCRMDFQYPIIVCFVDSVLFNEYPGFILPLV
jgi:hypothetical protein